MPGNVIERRKKIHEFVEKGDILGAVKIENALHGFRRFIVDPSYGDTFSVGDAYEEKLEKDVLNIGPRSIDRLKKLSRNDPELAELRIEHKCAHEGGHTFVPKAPSKVNGKSVPWPADDIIASQKKKGMDPYGPDAVAQQESQANLYAAVKCHEERSLDELLEVVAGQLWNNSVHCFYDELDTESGLDRGWAVRKLAEQYATLAGYTLWMKPQGIHRVVEKVVEIDECYRLRSQKASQNI